MYTKLVTTRSMSDFVFPYFGTIKLLCFMGKAGKRHGVFLAVHNNADVLLLMDIGNGLKEGESSRCDRERERPFCEDINMNPIEDEPNPFRLKITLMIGTNNPGSMEGLLESQGHRFVGNRRVMGLVLKLGARIGRL
ncbi:speckle-type POZ [Fusarium subglutinans]|uniref:Speckle-type POZ n=1 Tax=Gibberella subglutinans TaxID=42677 RepID=A0A8H5Q731_GIBSU|nr:speckle-type POZ [Fusarium subglutinans]KAF5609449.1 speckle-type POZ [Fusarium subglutinans]